jgi:integrase
MACITKRGGRYVLDFYDQDGKRNRLTLPGGTTKESARRALRGIEEKVENRTFIIDKQVKLFRVVAKEWIEYKKTRIRITSWKVCNGHLQNHFTEMNEKRIDRISTATVESFITAKQASGVSLPMIKKLMVTLGQVMGYAVRHKMVTYNPVRDAERPRATGTPGENHEMKILEPDQIKALIEAEPDQKYRTLYLTAIMTGARQGEVLGLQWGDVDFERKQIHIRRTYNHAQWFEPKTKTSIRKIDMAPILVRELAALKLASGGRGEDLVFPSEEGTPMLRHNITCRHFFPALKAAGITAIRWHDLRHTFASLLLAQGENVKYIQTQLGHSSPTVTLNVYSHLLKETNQEAACRLENTIFQATGHKMVTKEKKGAGVNG